MYRILSAIPTFFFRNRVGLTHTFENKIEQFAKNILTSNKRPPVPRTAALPIEAAKPIQARVVRQVVSQPSKAKLTEPKAYRFHSDISVLPGRNLLKPLSGAATLVGALFFGTRVPEEKKVEGDFESVATLLNVEFPDGKVDEFVIFDAIFDACLNQRWDIIDKIDIEILNKMQDRSGRTLLGAVAQEGTPAVLKVLLRKRISRRADKDGNTPLHLATLSSRGDNIVVLGPYFAQETNRKEQTALHLAITEGKAHLIPALFAAGLEMSQTCPYHNIPLNAFTLSIATGQSACLQQLIERAEKHEFSQHTPVGNILHLCAYFNQKLMLKVLLQKYYSFTQDLINQKRGSDGRTFLSIAAERGFTDVLRFLIKEKNADPDLPDSEGKTSAHWAAIAGHVDTLDWLIYLKANLQAWDLKIKSAIDYLNEEDKTYITNRIKQYLADKNMRPAFKQIQPEYIVLEGGGTKGLIYPAAFQAMEEEEGYLNNLQGYAGTSVGAILAGLRAVGYTGEELTKVVFEMNFYDQFDPIDNKKQRFESALKIVQAKSNSAAIFELLKMGAKEFLTLESPLAVYNRLSSLQGICAGDKLRDWIDERIYEKTNLRNCTYRELKKLIDQGQGDFKHLDVFATQVEPELKLIQFGTREEKFLDAVVSDTLMGSAAIPGVFVPREIRYIDPLDEDRKPYYKTPSFRVSDGGVLANLKINAYDDPKFQKAHVGKTDWKLGPPNPDVVGLMFSKTPPVEKQLQNLDQRVITGVKDLLSAIADLYWGGESIRRDQNEEEYDRIIEIPTSLGMLDVQVTHEELEAEYKTVYEAVKKALKDKKKASTFS